MTVDRLCVRTRYARRWLRRRHDRLAPRQRQRIALAALLLSPPPICGCCCGASYPEYQIPMKMKEPKDEIRSRRWPKVNVLLVAAALLVPFTLFMWRIFGTKETPQQEGAAGINFSVPEGREQQIESSSKRSWRRSGPRRCRPSGCSRSARSPSRCWTTARNNLRPGRTPCRRQMRPTAPCSGSSHKPMPPAPPSGKSSICGVRSRNSPHGSMRRRRQLPQIRWSWPSDNINWLRSTSAAEHRTSTPYRPNGDGSACCAPCRTGH